MNYEEINEKFDEFMVRDRTNGHAGIEPLYHKEWGWLQPVVIKIEQLGHIVCQCDNECIIDPNTPNEIKVDGVDKMDATYRALDVFIDDFNNQTLDY